MTVFAIILIAAAAAAVGFWQGTRYCAKRMLPYVLGRMNPRELARVIKRVSDLQDQG